MADTPDYDAPRHPVAELDEDVVQLKTPQAAPDLDETAIAEPKVDLIDEEPTVTVVPMLTDEFQCTSCYLVHHRSRLVRRADGSDVCPDCS
jgi:hypothetical protein